MTLEMDRWDNVAAFFESESSARRYCTRGAKSRPPRPDQRAVAVELDLVHPQIADGHGVDQRGQLTERSFGDLFGLLLTVGLCRVLREAAFPMTFAKHRHSCL
ncbi:MAG: hypothetical protein QM681_14730 [Novosphingobium sp.]